MVSWPVCGWCSNVVSAKNRPLRCRTLSVLAYAHRYRLLLDKKCSRRFALVSYRTLAKTIWVSRVRALSPTTRPCRQSLLHTERARTSRVLGRCSVWLKSFGELKSLAAREPAAADGKRESSYNGAIRYLEFKRRRGPQQVPGRANLRLRRPSLSFQIGGPSTRRKRASAKFSPRATSRAAVVTPDDKETAPAPFSAELTAGAFDDYGDCKQS